MSQSKPKTCLDPLYHLIEIDPIAIKIINTPPFQRLRHLNQTGLVEYVFPGATNNRFIHSLGVYHMAGILLNTLQKNQPELCISAEEILLVKLAGLCHDLGHGPWSHTFDQYLETKISNEFHLKTYKHEYRSCFIFAQIVKEYDVPLSESQINSICYLIDPGNENYQNESWSHSRSFLMDVISNTHDGLDVDKLDYLQRDPYYIGLTYKIDYTRIFQHAKVIDGRISYPFKIKSDIHDVFYYRIKLHREIYQHPVVKGIELLIYDIFDLMQDDIKDILHFADHELTPENKKLLYERFLSLTDTMIHSMYYFQTSDTFSNIFNLNLEIPHASFQSLKNIYLKEIEKKSKIKALIGRLSERKLYVFLGEIHETKKEEFDNIIKTLETSSNKKYELCMYYSKIGYETDPLEKINFDYSKNLSLITKESYSHGLKGVDSCYRIYSKSQLDDQDKNTLTSLIRQHQS
jgi:HD superfamily phosphohydrolase